MPEDVGRSSPSGRRAKVSCSGNVNGDLQPMPLLIHFDVNKTVIPSDSMQLTGIEDGLRESVADLFWGTLRSADGKLCWEWTRSRPSLTRPSKEVIALGQDWSATGFEVATYADYCRRTIETKEKLKPALRYFELVSGLPVQEEMERLVKLAMKKLLLKRDVRNSKEAEAAGITGQTLHMFPTLFHLASTLQRTGRPFAILFRSFGTDHVKVQQEWNAFCELRHPVFSGLIADLGPMDGSNPNIPDRRLHGIHTLYRDADGPMLIMDTLTNGPQDASWDSWVKGGSRPATDTRGGREFVSRELKASTNEGFAGIQEFMARHLQQQGTAAIKDDWAWWQYNGERAEAGKLLTLLSGKTQQLFFDDNIGYDDCRIVDCRGADGASIPPALSLPKICQKVNPVEAALDNNYFLRKLLSVVYSSPFQPSCGRGDAVTNGAPWPPTPQPPSSPPPPSPQQWRANLARAGLERGAQSALWRKRYRSLSLSAAELAQPGDAWRGREEAAFGAPPQEKIAQ